MATIKLKLKPSKFVAEKSSIIKHLLNTQTLKILPDAVRAKIHKKGNTGFESSRSSPKQASVLVPIVHVISDEDSSSNSSTTRQNATIPSILFTTRSSKLKDHANQISFPGGHIDTEIDGEGPDSIIRAALRETREELSSPPASLQDGEIHQYVYDFDRGIEVLGKTEPIPSIKNIPVTPVIACFKEEFTPLQIQTLFPGNESEVARVFTVSIEDLVQMEGEEPLKRLGDGFMGPIYPSKHGKIWGMTAVILKPILDHILKPIFLGSDRETAVVGSRL